MNIISWLRSNRAALQALIDGGGGGYVSSPTLPTSEGQWSISADGNTLLIYDPVDAIVKEVDLLTP